MRKLYTVLPLFMVALLAAFQMNAQSCTPDLMLPDSVVVDPLPYTEANPTRGIQDTACANTPFETFFNFQIPPTFTVLGTELPVANVTLATQGAVTNLPASMNYACNPPNCVFEANTTGCIVLYGTATPAEVGVHDLKINVVITAAGLPLPQQLPNPNIAPGNYFLHVKPEGSANCTVVGVEDEAAAAGFKVSVQPNPMGDYGHLSIEAPATAAYTFRLFNAMGQLAQQSRFELVQGNNVLPFDAAGLPAGVYVFQLTDGELMAGGRLAVQH